MKVDKEISSSMPDDVIFALDIGTRTIQAPRRWLGF